MMRFGIVLFVALGFEPVGARAACLNEFQARMDGVVHHGPYQIDGHFRSDRGEGRSEVKFIFPDRFSAKSYDEQGALIFGAIDVGDRSWRLGRDGHWNSFDGDDPYTLQRVIFRGSGNYRLATHVVCPDPVPNDVDKLTIYQYVAPAYDGYTNFVVSIAFDGRTTLPVSSNFTWHTRRGFGENSYKYRFDPYIHVEPPIPDPDP